MNRKYQYLLKNTGILTVSNFSARILSFLLVPIYTSVLTTSEYGQYELVMSSIQLFFPILSLNIVDAVMRFLMEKQNNRQSVVSIGVKYVVISIILTTIVILLNYYFAWFVGVKKYSFYVWGMFVTYALNQFLIQTAKGLELVKEIGAAGVISTFFIILGNIFFLLIMPIGLEGYYIAGIIGSLSSVIFLMSKTRFLTLVTIHHKLNVLQKEMLTYSFPLMLTSIGWWVNSLSDRYFVTWICGVAVNGIYSVAYKIPGIITTIQNIFMQAWQISAIKGMDDEDVQEFYLRTFTYLNLMITIGASVVILLVNFLADFLFSKEFYAAWKYVPFLLLSVIFNSAAGYVGGILSAVKNSKVTAYSAIVGIVVNLILNLALIPRIGAQGAAVATAFSSMTFFIIRLRYVWNYMSGKQFLKNAAAWTAVIFQAFLRIKFGFNWYELFVVLGILYIYRKEIYTILEKIKTFIEFATLRK